MKREFWRKAPQCKKCIYHIPEGKRPDSNDSGTVWKESCRFTGHSFWPELEEAEICFDFRSTGKDAEIADQAEKDKWAKGHLCAKCAFYGMNGFDLRDQTLIRWPEEWHAQHRCRGYVHCIDHDKEGFCSSFLSIDQWAIIEATPIYGGERRRKRDLFREINTSGKKEPGAIITEKD